MTSTTPKNETPPWPYSPPQPSSEPASHPLLSGAIVYHTTWRWIFYSHAIVSAAVVILMYFFFRETRGSVILSRKAQVLNTYYDKLEAAGHHGVIVVDKEEGEKIRRIRWRVKSDEDRASLIDMISQSCYRPFRKLPSVRLLSYI